MMEGALHRPGSHTFASPSSLSSLSPPKLVCLVSSARHYFIIIIIIIIIIIARESLLTAGYNDIHASQEEVSVHPARTCTLNSINLTASSAARVQTTKRAEQATADVKSQQKQ
jgi:hypothetical protein